MDDTYFAENIQIYVIIILFVFIFMFQKELLAFSNAIKKTSNQMKSIPKNYINYNKTIKPDIKEKVITKSLEVKKVETPKDVVYKIRKGLIEN